MSHPYCRYRPQIQCEEREKKRLKFYLRLNKTIFIVDSDCVQPQNLPEILSSGRERKAYIKTQKKGKNKE